MSQSQPFGNYQKRKFIRSPKKSYFNSPKGNKSQTKLFKYYSPSSESKKLKTSESDSNNSPSSKEHFKRNLFSSENDEAVITLSDDDDDKEFVLHFPKERKLPVNVEASKCSGSDLTVSRSCLELDQTQNEENVNASKCVENKLTCEIKSDKCKEVDKCVHSQNVPFEDLNERLKRKIEQFNENEIISAKSPCKIKVESKKPDDPIIEISPTKSVVSSEEVASLVDDIDWWDGNDFDEQINSNVGETTPSVEKQTTMNPSNIMEEVNEIDVNSSIKPSEQINRTVEPNEVNKSSELGKSNIVSNVSVPANENQHTTNLDTDALYYILNSPPAKIAWNTIFLHSNYQDVYKKYVSLSTEDKRLYGRLFHRKYDWLRLDNIKYDFVSDVAMSLTNLANVGFVKFFEPVSEDFSVVLNLMQADELKLACEVFKLNKRGKKSDIVECILRHIKRQPRLNFGYGSALNQMKKNVINILPKLVKLEDDPRNLFMSFLLITTCAQFKSKDDSRLVVLIDLFYRLNTGQLRLLELPLSATQVFKSLAKFREYEQSVKLVDNLIEAKKNKKWDQAKTLILQAKVELKVFLENKDNQAELDQTVDHLRKFTSGANYAYAISEGIEVLKKDKTNAGISEAVECLVLLLSQDYFIRGRRPSWYCELALLMERWKKFDEVFLTLKQGLSETSNSALGKLMLSQRCEMLIKRKHGLSIPQKNELATLSQIPPYRFSTNTIPATAMPNVSTNKKQIWTLLTDSGRAYMGVEERVRQHYMSPEGGGYSEGYHDEGRIILNLALCLFFKIIYYPLEGMFHVRFQDRPLDWGTSAFYRNRAEVIQDYIKHLQTGGIDGMMEEISEVCTKHTGKMSMVSWELIKIDQLPEIKKFLECVGVESFLKFCDYLLQAFKERSTGFPDLSLWNINKKKCLFVEVKGPSDKLSPKQILWLQKLNEFGIESEVCHVHTMHTGKRNVQNDSEPII